MGNNPQYGVNLVHWMLLPIGWDFGGILNTKESFELLVSYNHICTKNAVTEVISLNWINLLAVKFHFYLWGRIQPLQDVKTKKMLNLKVAKGGE